MAELEHTVDERVLKLWMANYKAKVTLLRQNLRTLLEQKKALNSRVVCQEYERFTQASEKVLDDDGTPTDVRISLIGLEKALKKEGLFKNVKGGFVSMKKEFLATPGTKTATKRPAIDPAVEHHPQRNAASGVVPAKFTHDRKRQQASTSGPDEVKNLNKAVGRLFDHLRIQTLSEIARESTGLIKTSGKPAIIAKKGDDTDDFKMIIQKVRSLENELLRQRASQSTELRRLSEENRGLRNTVIDMRREYDRLRSLQPIAKAAKEKQVGKMEEEFNKQKKGMEGKISELETELQENLETTLKEKADLEKMIVEGVSKLKVSVTSLHKRLCGEKAHPERTKSTLTLNGVHDERKNIDLMIRNIAQIEVEAQILEEKNGKLGKILIEKDSEIEKLRNDLIKISDEVTKMHGSIVSLDVNGATSGRDESGHTDVPDTSKTTDVIKKLQHVDSNIQRFKRILHQKEKSTVSPKNNDDLVPLKAQINRLYVDLMKDISQDNEGDKSDDSSIEETPKTQRERTDEINQLLQKLSRVEAAYNTLKQRNERKEV